MAISGLLIHSVPVSNKKIGKNMPFTKQVKVAGEIDIFDTHHSQDKIIAQSETFFCLPYDDSEYDRGGLCSV